MDIKPQNILVDNHTCRPLISDFGLARVLRVENNHDQTAGGSPIYMAPEQITNLAVDGRADIYATGIMLFQMLVPALPIRPYDSRKSLLKDKVLNKNGIHLKKASELNPTLDSEMDNIIRRATAYEAEQRYPNCKEFINDLKWYQRRFLYL